jgi:two-component system phosphate regulon sensor histidine kinase PhoR
VFSDVTELKKLDTAKSMFVSLVAHEVKSPLAATEGWLNLVLSGMLRADPAEERRMLERALLRVKSLRGMVNELISLTAIQTGNFSLKRAPVDVAKVVADAVETHREKAEGRQISLEICDQCMGALVLADREALSMIFSNLIENAVKYSHEGGHVWVQTGREGMYVTVSVKDDGIGMSREDSARVFEEFYRARNEQTASIPGTGLGLSLVKRLTELHEGTVSVSSEPDKGSEFTVRLPCMVTEPSP